MLVQSVKHLLLVSICCSLLNCKFAMLKTSGAFSPSVIYLEAKNLLHTYGDDSSSISSSSRMCHCYFWWELIFGSRPPWSEYSMAILKTKNEKTEKNEKSWIWWNGRLTMVILWCEILINTAIYYLAAFNISKCHCKILKKSGLVALNTRILSLTGCRAFSSISLGSYNIFQPLICAMHFIIIIIFKSIKYWFHID